MQFTLFDIKQFNLMYWNLIIYMLNINLFKEFFILVTKSEYLLLIDNKTVIASC